MAATIPRRYIPKGRTTPRGRPVQPRPENRLFRRDHLSRRAVADGLRDLARLLFAVLPDPGDPDCSAPARAVRIRIGLYHHSAHLCGNLGEGLHPRHDTWHGDTWLGLE